VCDDAQIAMARNLMGYLIAADYLASLGIGSANVPYDCNSGQPGLQHCWNEDTWDSLKTFAKRFGEGSTTVKASSTTRPKTSECGGP
jgi:hypothetical protein